MALIGAGVKMFNISDISAQLIFMKWNLFLLYVFLSVLLHEYQERTLLLSGGLYIGNIFVQEVVMVFLFLYIRFVRKYSL